jgi:hypothetical protein
MGVHVKSLKENGVCMWTIFILLRRERERERDAVVNTTDAQLDGVNSLLMAYFKAPSQNFPY